MPVRREQEEEQEHDLLVSLYNAFEKMMLLFWVLVLYTLMFKPIVARTGIYETATHQCKTTWRPLAVCKAYNFDPNATGKDYTVYFKVLDELEPVYFEVIIPRPCKTVVYLQLKQGTGYSLNYFEDRRSICTYFYSRGSIFNREKWLYKSLYCCCCCCCCYS